jgi:hypothetical protein
VWAAIAGGADKRLRRLTPFVAAALSVLSATQGAAQDFRDSIEIPDPDGVKVHIGPLGVNPSVALTNFGVDTNVFNEPEAAQPKKDLTFSLTPRADLSLRLGPSWVSGKVKEDFVWYRTYSSERGVNGTYEVGWVLPLSRMVSKIGGDWVHTSERPGFEIDSRPDRQERAFVGAIETRALSRTRVGFHFERRAIEFDEDAVFDGTTLSDELNRTSTAAAVIFRLDLTSMTTLTLDVTRQKENFDTSPLRDATSTILGAAFQFDPVALVSGTARFGYRNFAPETSLVPGYSGVTAAVDLSYVAFGGTRLTGQLNRDLQYSYQSDHPYYLQTGGGVTITQQIYGPVDVQGRFSGHSLAYRAVEATATAVDRVDHLRSFGGGVGYLLGVDARLAFNIDRQRRQSPDRSREFEGLRYGISLTYGR